MRRLPIVIGLQCYAILLAAVQAMGGVRTDEAKYLLNIPYPHPPLARWILSQTEIFPFQEWFWRIIFATTLVYAVWFVWGMHRKSGKEQRLLVCGLWLLSAAVLLQSGSIMMAPLTALQALVFVWLLSRKDNSPYAELIAMFWFASLFTAYQAILFMPLTIEVFRRMHISPSQKVMSVGLPLLALAFYTLTNPLIPASMLNAGHQNDGISAAASAHGVVLLWIVAGSAVLSILGMIGTVRKKNAPVIFSFVLVSFYVLISYRFYYAILFTPLFVANVPEIRYPRVTLAFHSVVSAICIALFPLSTQMSTARSVMSTITPRDGTVLVSGSFGHEWQYESSVPVQRYQPSLQDFAAAIVCLDPCEGINESLFTRVENSNIDLFVRK